MKLVGSLHARCCDGSGELDEVKDLHDDDVRVQNGGLLGGVDVETTPYLLLLA